MRGRREGGGGGRGGLVHMGSGQGTRLPKPHRNNIRFTEEGVIKDHTSCGRHIPYG